MADLAAASSDRVEARLHEALAVKQAMIEDPSVCEATRKLAAAIVQSLDEGGKVIFFGNGGSAMDAGHLAAEFVGRYCKERRSLPALSLADHTAAMSAIANDYAFADVFSRQIAGLGRPGDVLIGLTTSGNSANVVKALREGRERDMVTAVLTGSGGGDAVQFADIAIAVPTGDTALAQEACMHLGHTICELVELEFVEH